jgi:hypothetical protein
MFFLCERALRSRVTLRKRGSGGAPGRYPTDLTRARLWQRRPGVSNTNSYVGFCLTWPSLRTVMRALIHIDCDHVRPLFEIVLTCRREFVLIIFRPTVEITDASEHERGFPFCSGSHVGCNERQARAPQKPGGRKFSCCRRRGNRRRNSCRNLFSPAGTMQNQKNQPADEREQAAWKTNKHQPAHDAE